MLQSALDCVLSPELDCFFESEPIGCEEPVAELGELFDSPDFNSFLSLLDTSMGDVEPDAALPHEASDAHLPPAAEQATSSESGDDSHRSLGSAGSAAHHPQTSTPTSSTAEPVSHSRDSHTATSNIKTEPLPFVSTSRAANHQQHARHRAAGPSEPATAPSSPDSSKSNKRKLPEIDWRSIDDPEERRRQRRLAKNRVTAARSRERKKLQWNELQQKMDDVEDENMRLKEMLDKYLQENSLLKDQLASLTRGASAAVGRGGEEPAALINIAKSLLFRLPPLAAETAWMHGCCSAGCLDSICSARMILSRNVVVYLMPMLVSKQRAVPLSFCCKANVESMVLGVFSRHALENCSSSFLCRGCDGQCRCPTDSCCVRGSPVADLLSVGPEDECTVGDVMLCSSPWMCDELLAPACACVA